MAGEQDQQLEPAPRSVRQLLVDWANEQDGWVRHLAGGILTSRRSAGQEVVDVVTREFLAEKGLSDDAPTARAVLELDDEVIAEEAPFLISQIAEVKGVNALSPDQVLDFNHGLTILFGENGSGKTGYARILKTLAAVRGAEEILPDVYAINAPNEQAATITFEQADDTDQTLNWTGESGVPPFTHLSIFDTPAVSLHVDNELSYRYTPGDLALFQYLNEAIGAVRDGLQESVDGKRPDTNPYLPYFTRGTSIYAEIEVLGATTDAKQLAKFATSGDKERAELEQLGLRLTALKSQAISDQQKVARARQGLYQRLTEAASIARSFDLAQFNRAIQAGSDAQKTYAKLRSDLAKTAGLEGDGEERWQEFIHAGEAYRKHAKAGHYPGSDDKCIYCQQPLSGDAIQLLKRYEEFANDSLRKSVADAQLSADRFSQRLNTIQIDQIKTAIHQEQPDLTKDKELREATDFLTEVARVQADIQQRRKLESPDLIESAETVETASKNRHGQASEQLQDLQSRAEERTKTLEETQTKHDLLKDRIELAKHLKGIEERIETARWVQRLEELLRKFPVLLRGLTDVSKVASEQLLNTDFERQFKEECAALRAPKVELDFPGRQGQAARRKATANHRPSKVLSEGEQKVLALADFLAEAALRLTPAPLVFDDPVNSLDYRRIREVSDRIALLAADSQVIVFTHNIWFVSELLSRFAGPLKGRCTCHTVAYDSNHKGVIHKDATPRLDSPKAIEKEINKTIDAAQSVDGAALEALLGQAYNKIRSWCEVVVETELLANVVRRYQPNVMMTALPRIKPDRLGAAISTVSATFEKACRYIDGHSQPLEQLSVRPSLQELEEDWKNLQDARKEYLA